MSLTAPGIPLDLGDKARLLPISTKHMSWARRPPLTLGNVISPIANRKSNMVQSRGLHCFKVIFSDPCVPVVH